MLLYGKPAGLAAGQRSTNSPLRFQDVIVRFMSFLRTTGELNCLLTPLVKMLGLDMGPLMQEEDPIVQ